MMRILIKNIDIIPGGYGKEIIKNGNIGVEDSKICFVNAALPELEQFPADRVLDGKNKLAIPGLVNAHTHCAMTLFRNYADDVALEEWLFERILPKEALMTSDDIYWGSLLGIAEMIRSGTTAFADMYLHMDRVAQAVLESGIRANLSRSPLHLKVRGRCRAEDDSQGCYDYYNEWNGQGNGRIRVYVEVHSTYLFSMEALAGAAQLAGRCQTGIHIHLHETAKEVEESRKKQGMSPIELCERYGIFDVPVIAAHGVHLTDSDREIIQAKGVSLVHNPTSNLKLGSGIADVPALLRKGIRVCLGTDGAASNNNLNLFNEMHLAALLHKGVSRDPQVVSARDVLEMATANGAKALGFGDAVGRIEKGMNADIVLLDTDKPHFYPMNDPYAAMVYSAEGSDVDTVIVDGRILMEGRELKTIDEERVKSMVKGISAKLG